MPAINMQMSDAGTVVVAARLRPFLPKEEESAHVWTKGEVRPPAVLVRVPGEAVNETPRTFSVDQAFADTNAPGGSQASVYRELGSAMLSRAITQGTSSCLIAYGAKGSGKSHSILGYGNDPGLIPRVTSELFKMVATVRPQLRVWCSYFEICQERIRDLLRPGLLHEPGAQLKSTAPALAMLPTPPGEGELRICEMPNAGVCIPLLTESAVKSIGEVKQLVDHGNKLRTVTAGQLCMAGQSHTVFVLHVAQPAPEPPQVAGALRGSAGTWRARLSFVDCVSAEQRSHDQSLKALHEVVAGLKLHQKQARGALQLAKLTQYLAEPLTGRAHLVWLANLSSAPSSLNETMATLEFTSSVREVLSRSRGSGVSRTLVTHEMLVQDLRLELHRLQASRVNVGPEVPLDSWQSALQRFHDSLGRPYDVQLREAENLRSAQQAILNSFGLARYETEAIVRSESSLTSAYLVNISSDPMLSGCLLYKLRYGLETRIGTAPDNAILLRGLSMAAHHCSIRSGSGGVVELWNSSPERNRVLLNGKLVADVPHDLHDDDVIILGYAHAFRFVSSLESPLKEISLEDCLLCAELHSPSIARASAELGLEAVRRRFGEARCQKLTAELRSLCPLVDEANELTRELRPNDNLHLEVVACGIAFDSTDSTELSGVEVADLAAVRVLRLSSNGDPGSPRHNGLGHELLDLWTVEKFMDRLRAIRGLYEERCIVGSKAAALWEADPLLDPWCDPSLSEIWRRSVKDPQNTAKLLHWAGPWAEASIRGSELPGASPKRADAVAPVAAVPAAAETARATGVAPVQAVQMAPVQRAVSLQPGVEAVTVLTTSSHGALGNLGRQSSIETDGSLESRVLVSSDTSNGGAGCCVADVESHQAIGEAVSSLQKIIADLRNDQKLPEDSRGFDLRASIIERLEAQNAELHSDLARVEEQLKVRNKSLAKLTHSVVPTLTAGNLMQHESNGSAHTAEICRSFPASGAPRTEWTAVERVPSPDGLARRLQLSTVPPADGIPVIVQTKPLAAPIDGLSVSVRMQSPGPAAERLSASVRIPSPTTPHQQTPPREKKVIPREPDDNSPSAKLNGSPPYYSMPQVSWPFCYNGNVPAIASPPRPFVATRSGSPTIVARSGICETARVPTPGSPNMQARPMSVGRCRVSVHEVQSPESGSLRLPRASSESTLPPSGCSIAAPAPVAYQWPAGANQVSKLSSDGKPSWSTSNVTPVRLRVTVGGASSAAAGQPPPRVQPVPLPGSMRVAPGTVVTSQVRGVTPPSRGVSPVPSQARGISPGPRVHERAMRGASPGPQVRTFTPVRQSSHHSMSSVQRQRSSSAHSRQGSGKPCSPSASCA